MQPRGSNRRLLHRLVVLMVLLCSPAVQACAAHGLQRSILQHVRSGTSDERYTACLLLAELPLTPSSIAAIESRIPKEPDRVDRLCLRYVLAKRTQDAKFAKAFIAAYPAGETVQTLLRRQEDTGYPLGIASPLQQYLAELAYQSDDALSKLLATLPHADGAQRQALVDALAPIYGSQPARVEHAAQAAGVSIVDVKADWQARTRHE